MNLFLNEVPNLRQIFNIYKLYIKSFPKNERKPFFLMLIMWKKKTFEILSIEDDKGDFVGLAIVIRHKDLALLDYFAISSKKRNSGAGSKAFYLLKEKYKEQRFFLEIEDTSVESIDSVNRIRRKNFYLKNGMSSLAFKVKLFDVEMELMGDNCNITFEEYHSIFKHLFGTRINKNVLLMDS